jgi:tetratricopeptide (TPR) repeat protein
VLGKAADAVRTYEELAESVERVGRDTDRRWARATMGRLRTAQGRWDEALELLDSFLAEVEAGSPHYLDSPTRASRSTIRLARGDHAGALADTDRALEAARLAGDAQLVAVALVARTAALCATEASAEAAVHLDETLALGGKLVRLTDLLVELAWCARALGSESELLDALDGAPDLPWVSTAAAVAAGDFERAVRLLAQIDSPTATAYAHLRTTQELVGAGQPAAAEPHLEAALTFYRQVRATHFIREVEALRQRASTG